MIGNNMKVVVDTSVAIDFLRRRTAKKSIFAILSGKVELVISLITVAELYTGKSVWNNQQQQKLVEEMLLGVEIITPTLDTAREAGRLRAANTLSLADAFIAALAIKLKLPLATLDTKDFSQIKELKLYSLRDCLNPSFKI